jgi:hypothetical protein
MVQKILNKKTNGVNWDWNIWREKGVWKRGGDVFADYFSKIIFL